MNRMGRGKRASRVAVLLAMALSFAACGSGGDASSQGAAQTAATQSTASEKPAISEESAATEESAAESASVAESAITEEGGMGEGSPGGDGTGTNADDGSMREGLTALEVTEFMGNGINLGNTMEAYGRTWLGACAQPTEYETCWGQPVTTQEMLDGMKAAGFDTLRLPVAWTNAMNFETGDYTIDGAYLDRVEEIVGYARNAGMYVIINDHWDGGWWGMFGSASQETRDSAMELYRAMWTQIGERFGEYSDYVIFESGNEELGHRLNDTDIAPDSGTLSDTQCYTVANEINQAFVDTIRGLGGNNSRRFLLIAGFNTDIRGTCDSRYKMPADTAEDKLLISVHYYEPSGYCINSSIGAWGTRQEYETMNDTLAMMKSFTDRGYGVIVGEYGVRMKDDAAQPKDNTGDYVRNLLNNCDLYGYCPVLWDCSNLYSRGDCEIVSPEIAALYTEHSRAVEAERAREDVTAQARKEMDEDYGNAGEGAGVEDGTALAWIMYGSEDWSVQYSVGDTYAPFSSTAGIAATDVEVTGEGTYTVALDFTGVSGGHAQGVGFSALAIAGGEQLFPGYCMEIQEILINGEPYEPKGQPYTSSDDGKTTRVNLYNAWVGQVQRTNPGVRVREDNGLELTACVLDADTLGDVETLAVTFHYAK